MACVASSSRSTLRRISSKIARHSALVRRRNFTTTARTSERLVSITFASSTSSFRLPSLASIMETILPSYASLQPSLAGIPSPQTEEMSKESQDILEWDGTLNAVPKSKVSHSRKAMRSANKGLKDRVDFVHCASCGQPKLAHHICPSCFSIINRAHKADKKHALKAEARAGSRAEAREILQAAQATPADSLGHTIIEDGDSHIVTSTPRSRSSRRA